MNRQQRRSAERKGTKDPRYNLSESEINQIKREAVDRAMMLLLYIPIRVMQREYGWGVKSRLPKLADQLLEEYQGLTKTDIPLKFYADEVKALSGITFERKDDRYVQITGR